MKRWEPYKAGVGTKVEQPPGDRAMSKENPGVVRERLAGSLRGLLVGDALGVPYEFLRQSGSTSPRLMTFLAH